MGTRHAVVGRAYDLQDEGRAGMEGMILVITGFLVGLIVGMWAEN